MNDTQSSCCFENMNAAGSKMWLKLYITSFSNHPLLSCRVIKTGVLHAVVTFQSCRNQLRHGRQNNRNTSPTTCWPRCTPSFKAFLNDPLMGVGSGGQRGACWTDLIIELPLNHWSG